jgi:Zn-dependent alcohol dehydrogenase
VPPADEAPTTLEVVGAPATISQAFASARCGGTVIVMGVPSSTDVFQAPAIGLFAESKTITGSFFGGVRARRDFPLIASLVEQGHLGLVTMVSRRLNLDNVNEAFAAMTRSEVIRRVITW